METLLIFLSLNKELKKRKIIRELFICGGAALISLKIVKRGTKDVDVLKPKIDPDLNEAAAAVAGQHKLIKNWLNNGPSMLVAKLPQDWEAHCVTVFTGTHLTIKAIGRRDLIYSKLYAAADRVDDVDDLVALKPTELELAEARNLVLQQDASEFWPAIVDECLAQVRKRLERGR